MSATPHPHTRLVATACILRFANVDKAMSVFTRFTRLYGGLVAQCRPSRATRQARGGALPPFAKALA